jgi:Zn-dependent membrane protease YugP
MAKRKVDWNAPTEQQVARGLRVMRGVLVVAAVKMLIIAGVAFWLGVSWLGIAAVLLAVVSLPVAWRVTNRHYAQLRAKAVPDSPFSLAS